MTSSTPSSRRCCKCTQTLKHDETAAALFGASTDSNGDGVGVFYFYDYYSNEMRNVRIYYDSIFYAYQVFKVFLKYYTYSRDTYSYLSYETI